MDGSHCVNGAESNRTSLDVVRSDIIHPSIMRCLSNPEDLYKGIELYSNVLSPGQVS